MQRRSFLRLLAALGLVEHVSAAKKANNAPPRPISPRQKSTEKPLADPTSTNHKTPNPSHSGSLSNRQPFPLLAWRSKPRLSSLDQLEFYENAALRSAFATSEPLLLQYSGGSTPGEFRLFTVEHLFHHKESPNLHYLSGYCHLRRESRILRLDRCEFETPTQRIQ